MAENRLLALSLCVSVAVAVVGLVVALELGSWLTGTGPDEESGSTTIRNLGFVVAGLVALPLAVWRATAAERQAGTAEADLLNKRYQESSEMLGSAVLAVRLAGIYALERLAKDHPEQYHIEIMKLLCVFVRNPTPDEGAEHDKVREDVQAVMEAISACHARQQRLEERAKFRLDLRGADLERLDLQQANLSGARLMGADLKEAILRGADLSGAWFGSPLWWVRVDVPETNLTRAKLERAILAGARLHRANLTNANLMGANLTGASLTSTNLSRTMFASRSTVKRMAIGLTQQQLDKAIADPDQPPRLEGIKDPDSGEQLVPPRDSARWERYQRSKKKS